MNPASIRAPSIQLDSPFQYLLPTRTIGKRCTLPVWISVSVSNSSSRVPKPPGNSTNAVAYFTSITLRTKK